LPPVTATTSRRGPVSNPLKWIVPAGIGVIAIAGAGLFFFANKGKKSGGDRPTAAPTPIAITPTRPTPVPPVKPTPTKVTPAPTGIKEVTVSDLAPLANQEQIKEKLLLVGEFRVSSAVDRVVIARPAATELTSLVRVSARFPQGTQLPAEGSIVNWTKDTSLIVRGVRTGNDGQLNIEVESQK
jgi:hypothetical protein